MDNDFTNHRAGHEAVDIKELEWRLLRSLCQSGDMKVREQARSLLGQYRWVEGAHQAVFEILMCFPHLSSAPLRDQLPARLTRRGFPDFDFEALFSSPAPSSAESEEWMRELAVMRAS